MCVSVCMGACSQANTYLVITVSIQIIQHCTHRHRYRYRQTDRQTEGCNTADSACYTADSVEMLKHNYFRTRGV